MSAPLDVSARLAVVELDPRVIEARRRLERGEITKQRVYQVTHEAAGLCLACSRLATSKGMCELHQRPRGRSKPMSHEARRRDNHAKRVARRAARGLPPDAILGQGGPGLKRRCKACGEEGHFAKTCANVARGGA